MNKTRQGGRFDVALAHQDNGGVRVQAAMRDLQNHLNESNLSDPSRDDANPAGADRRCRIATRAFYQKTSPAMFRRCSLPAQYRPKKMPAITFCPHRRVGADPQITTGLSNR
jgi:hypothetical protein